MDEIIRLENELFPKDSAEQKQAIPYKSYMSSPFIAAALSLAILNERPAPTYFAALVLMAVGAWLSSGDKPVFKRRNK